MFLYHDTVLAHVCVESITEASELDEKSDTTLMSLNDPSQEIGINRLNSALEEEFGHV